MSDPGQLQVRGGAGGVSAQLEDLERAGELLRIAAGGLAEHGRTVAAMSIDPRLQLTAALSPMTFARAEAALAAAAFGPGGLFALATRTELLGTGALTVAKGYRTADAAAAGLLRAVATLTGQAIGLSLGVPTQGLGARAVVTILELSGAVRDTDAPESSDGSARTRPGSSRLPEPLRRIGGLTLRLLADHARLTEAVIPAVPGVLGGLSITVPGGPLLTARVFGHPVAPTTVAEVGTGLGVIGGLVPGGTGGPPWFRESGQIQTRMTPAPWHRPPSGTAELLGRIPEAPPGRPRIHLERIDGTAGRRWVVSVPGTADWSSIAGRTPLDLTGNIRLMAGERSAGMAGVVQAMRTIGVRKGEPVLLVGHSQGGLIAAALAADPKVRREFTVSHVLTSGAPVASIPVPAEVQVLSIEHSDDMVPRLDGSANHDRPNWITVTAPAPTAGLPAVERTEPLLAHRAQLYQSTAERVDRSTDPSILVWRAGLAPFLDGAPGFAAGNPGSGAGWDVEISRVGTS